MKYLANFILLIFILIFAQACFQRQILIEQEKYQIRTFILKLGVKFDTTPCGVYYRIDSLADSNHIKMIQPDDTVMLVYTGYNLDKNEQIFVKNDTVFVWVNDPFLMEGWREIFLRIPHKAYGQAIFPFYTAFDKKRILNIPPYSTLYFKFYVQ